MPEEATTQPKTISEKLRFLRQHQTLVIHRYLQRTQTLATISRDQGSDGNRIFGDERLTHPVFKAIWADHRSFDEVLISKRMVQDHMPDNVLRALEKVR